MKPVEYYDQHGREIDEPDKAWSKVVCKPWDFTFYVKKTIKIWRFRFSWWSYHHWNNTCGGWMWPKGLPMKFTDDGEVIDQTFECINHAASIGSKWCPGAGYVDKEDV